MLPGSHLLKVAEQAGLPVVTEAFADRAYTERGTLVPRSQDGAVITDAAMVIERSVTLARSGTVVSHSGEHITVRARSLCLHGDTPGAISLAHRIRKELHAAGVTIAPLSDVLDAKAA